MHRQKVPSNPNGHMDKFETARPWFRLIMMQNRVTNECRYNHTFPTRRLCCFQTTISWCTIVWIRWSLQNGTGVGNGKRRRTKCSWSIWLTHFFIGWKNTTAGGFVLTWWEFTMLKPCRQIRWALDEDDHILIWRRLGYGDPVLRLMTRPRRTILYQMPNIGFFNDDQRDAIKGGRSL